MVELRAVATLEGSGRLILNDYCTMGYVDEANPSNVVAESSFKLVWRPRNLKA